MKNLLYHIGLIVWYLLVSTLIGIMIFDCIHSFSKYDLPLKYGIPILLILIFAWYFIMNGTNFFEYLKLIFKKSN